LPFNSDFMADKIPAPGEGIPPSATSGAPGYEAATGGGHVPPPLSIPQNTNAIPTTISSPMNNGQNILSPQSAGGFIRRAAPEPNKRSLYVGGLDPRVTEDVLRQIFDTVGHVLTVKIIPDKNVSVSGFYHPCGTAGFLPFFFSLVETTGLSFTSRGND
jgi:nucleolysin TIA-1/TIAR